MSPSSPRPEQKRPGKPRNEAVKTVFGSPEELAAHLDGRLVIAFGEPPGGAPPEVLHQADADADPVAAAADLDPKRMVKGLLFTFGPGWEATDLAVIQAAQRRILHSYYRYAFFPSMSPNTPDPYGVRPEQDQVPELVRMISTLRNIPYLLRYPVADKLNDLKLGLPALLLLPGPSLKEFGPRLPELARHCLVVCVSRSLAWCLEQGVEPDFVVQLDTYLVQQHIYADIPHLPRTTLVPISIAPVHRYAHKFRGCFFMDSFNTGVLPNPFRLRENHVSSLMACLGLAECLHAPEAFLVGADLSMPRSGEAYFCSDEGWEAAQSAEADGPLEVNGIRFELNDAAGNRVHTLLRYLATAEEAGFFARDILASTGTRFRNLAGRGILSSRWYATADPDEISASPLLDREAFLARLDKGLARGEDINLIKYKVELLKSLEVARETEVYLRHCLQTGQVEEAYRHPLARFMRRERDLFIGGDDAHRLPAALRLVRVWERELSRAKGYVQARMLLGRGKEVAVLCMPGEEDLAARRLGKLFPEGGLVFLNLTHHAEPGRAEPGKAVALNRFEAWLEARDLVLVSEAVRREYGYFFQVRGGDKIIVLDRLLDDPDL